jgi:hypothetical protein
MPTKQTQHAELLDIAHRTIRTFIAQDHVRTAGAPLLSHPDLHTRNIFVLPEDPTVITGIVDWQPAAVEPAYVFAAETPDFAAEPPEQEESEQPADKDSTESQALANLKTGVDFCVKTWSMVPSICPKLREASQLDDSVVQLLSAPSNGWLDDDDSLRSMLSNLKQKWTELGLPGESCYQETQEEAKALETRLDRRQATERLRKFLSRQLGCDNDGWVATDRWEDVLPRYREIYRSFVESVAESDPDEDADDLWPFDQR